MCMCVCAYVTLFPFVCPHSISVFDLAQTLAAVHDKIGIEHSTFPNMLLPQVSYTQSNTHSMNRCICDLHTCKYVFRYSSIYCTCIFVCITRYELQRALDFLQNFAAPVHTHKHKRTYTTANTRYAYTNTIFCHKYFSFLFSLVNFLLKTSDLEPVEKNKRTLPPPCSKYLILMPTPTSPPWSFMPWASVCACCTAYCWYRCV